MVAEYLMRAQEHNLQLIAEQGMSGVRAVGRESTREEEGLSLQQVR